MGRMTTVMVPKDLRDLIKALADAEGKPMWRVVEEAVSFRYAEKKRPAIKDSLSHAEKVAWYLSKVLMSVGELKARADQESYSRLEKTVLQIADRLKLPHTTVNLLLSRCREFVRASPDLQRVLRREVNAAAKMLAVDIMTSEAPTVEEED